MCTQIQVIKIIASPRKRRLNRIFEKSQDSRNRKKNEHFTWSQLAVPSNNSATRPRRKLVRDSNPMEEGERRSWVCFFCKRNNKKFVSSREKKKQEVSKERLLTFVMAIPSRSTKEEDRKAKHTGIVARKQNLCSTHEINLHVRTCIYIIYMHARGQGGSPKGV